MANTVDEAAYVLSVTATGQQSVQAATKTIDDLVTATEKATGATKKRTEAEQAAAEKTARLYSQVGDNSIKIEERRVARMEAYERAVKRGTITEAQRAELIDRNNARAKEELQQQLALNEAQQRSINVITSQGRAYQTIGTHMDKAATATGLARHEMINLSRQIQDVGVSLAGGQSPLRVLIEQGSQIADIFASSRVTITGFFGQVLAGAGRFAASMAGVVTIIGTFVGAGAAAALSWLSAQRDIQQALLGVGRASGSTVADINRIGETASSAFGLSVSEAREFASALAATGKVSAEVNAQVTAMGKDLSRILGVSVAEAGKVAAQAFADPAKGVDLLNARLGSFDAATRRSIMNLQEQNKSIEAQNLLIEGMKRGLAGVPENVGKIESAWTAVANAVANAWDWTGKFIARQTGLAPTDWAAELKKAEDAMAAIRARQAQRGANIFGFGADAGPDTAVLGRLEQWANKARSELQKVSDQAAETKRVLESIKFEEAIRGALPEVAQFEKLRNQAELLADAIAKINRSGGAQESPMLASLGMTMQQVQLAAARTREALESALSPAQKLTAEFELQVAQITARSGSERAAVAARQTELQLAGQNVSAEEKALAVSRARYLVLLQIAAAHRNAMAALEDQVRVSSAVTGQEKLRAQEIATTNALMREGFSMQQASDQAAMQRLATQKQIDASIQSQVIAIQSQIQYMRDVQEYGQGAAEAAKAYRDAITQGASQTAAAALAAATLERNMEEAQIAAERLADRLQTAGGAASSLGQGLGAKLDAIGTGSGSGKSFSAGTGFDLPGSVVHTTIGGSSVSATGVGGIYNRPAGTWFDELRKMQRAADAAGQEIMQKRQEEAKRLLREQTPGTDEYIAKQRQLAQAAADAARALQDAAEAAAKLAEETAIENVASLILAGITPQAINRMIESGQLYAGGASQRFETQLDLYRRAGMTNAQILADIRAGYIGEGVRASELLRAIDDLTGAVEANTESLSALSPFYSQQGDRLLGYRGFEVQRRTGGSSLGGIGGVTGSMGGIPTTGTSGGMGGIVNVISGPISTPIGGAGASNIPGVPAGYVQYPYSYLPGLTMPSNFIFVNGKYYYKPIPETTPTTGTGPNPSWGNPYVTPTSTPITTFGTGLSGGFGYTSKPFGFDDGGIAYGPQMAIFGEGAVPEAFVPLRGGRIPVRLQLPPGAQARDEGDRPVINITAPLIYFAAEPRSDEVRETSFQAAQALRRLVGRAA
jgi:hypothetical protein